MIRNRIICAIGGSGILVAAAVMALWLADYRSGEDVFFYCSQNTFGLWPWLSCVVTAHKSVTIGLIVAASAIFAGWLAFVDWD
jgi:hypothetical protein